MKPCSICTHRDRAAIDTALLSGSATFKRIAETYKTSMGSLSRHKNRCLAVQYQKAEARRQTVENRYQDTLWETHRQLHDRVMRTLDSAEKAGSLGLVIGGIREARELLKLRAQLENRLATAPTTNVYVSSEFREVMAFIWSTLGARYPEAKEFLMAEFAAKAQGAKLLPASM